MPVTASLVAVQVTTSPQSEIASCLADMILVYDVNAPDSAVVWQSSVTAVPWKSHVREEIGLVSSVVHSNLCSPGVTSAVEPSEYDVPSMSKVSVVGGTEIRNQDLLDLFVLLLGIK